MNQPLVSARCFDLLRVGNACQGDDIARVKALFLGLVHVQPSVELIVFVAFLVADIRGRVHLAMPLTACFALRKGRQRFNHHMLKHYFGVLAVFHPHKSGLHIAVMLSSPSHRKRSTNYTTPSAPLARLNNLY
jgi:hypothetical protein